MKKYDLFKMAAQKVLSEEHCILSIKVVNCDGVNELSAIGIVDKHEDVILDISFEPLRNGEAEREGAVYFKSELDNLLRILSKYEYVVVFGGEATRRIFIRTAEKYGLNTRLLEKAFKKFFCAQILYDAYIGFAGTKLEVACKVEHIDVSDTRDAISVSYLLQEFVRAIASEYTYPNPTGYAELLAKAYPNTKKDTEQPRKKKETAKPKKAYVNYIDLFNSGKSIEEIAQNANVKVQTVETHILNAYEQGKIDSVDKLIQSEYEQKVLDIVNAGNWDGKLRSVKDAMPEDCNYLSIRAIIAKNKRVMAEDAEKERENCNESGGSGDAASVEV